MHRDSFAAATSLMSGDTYMYVTLPDVIPTYHALQCHLQAAIEDESFTCMKVVAGYVYAQ